MNGDSPATDLPAPLPVLRTAPTGTERVVALIQVLLCSDFPTQMLLAGTFAAFGYNGDLQSLGFVTALLLADTALLLGLIWIFLRAQGESPRDLFLGTAPVPREVRAGLPMTFAAFAIAAAAIVLVRTLAPWLHTVEKNPLPELIQSPPDAVLFTLVAVIAGGFREELQRAFLLTRFERSLGGRAVGVIVTSVAFGAGHRVQGNDAAIATGLLGAFWAVVYFRRRSSVAPIVSHSGFNLLQLLQLLVVRQSLGG
jgi:membrane protease YdiL (CAAX protease family)